ncbi:MAG TPA: metal-dependent transcriptional regulator [Candidatus Aquilonibacter sp.]|nr:metal-dependent transcriptional regulator [Candidatus Aquilonibacter sp.]
MPAAEITVSKEDYLKAIIEAESEGHTVIPAFLAQWLEVSQPAVTKALRRLREDGYVSSADGPLKLTSKGREAAHRTALRHHLVERMLSEIFHMEWHHIHAEAERLEHVISPAFEAKLIERLGPEGDCPHGNRVLPETPAQLQRRGLVRLSDAPSGRAMVVASLYERDARLLEFLHTLNIGPGVTLTPIARNYDDTLRVRTPSREITLGLFAAHHIWLRPPTPAKPRKPKAR